MSNKSSNGGIGLCGALTLIFVTLKLAEAGSVAQWSWWWVMSPLWVPFVIGVALVLVLAILLILLD